MLNISLNGISVPRLGFGTYELTGQKGADATLKALEVGYRHIDTAQFYDNEETVGEAIKQSGVDRDDVFLTTKIWQDPFVNDTVMQSVDESLRKLQTDYVDLLLIHWPFPDVPVKKMVEDVMTVKQAGKTKLIGVSNFTVSQVQEAIDVSGGGVVCNQVEYHPRLNQKPVLDILRANDMALTSYSPLGRGSLLDDPVIQDIAQQHGKGPGQIVLRWHMQQDNVIAIPKSGTPKNIENNFDIFDFELSGEEMDRIFALASPDGRIIDPPFAPKWDQAA